MDTEMILISSFGRCSSEIDRNISNSINIPVSLSKSEDGAAVFATDGAADIVGLWDGAWLRMGKQKVLQGVPDCGVHCR
jgi:hypothetical protein